MIDHLVELKTILKRLKLSGMLDSVELRNQEAINNKLSYSEFLLLLLQDEMHRRDNNRLALRLKQSGFRPNKTLESFDFNFNPNINRQTIYDLATGRFIEEKAPILIAGPTGTGKSHIAQAIGHCVLQKGLTVRMFTQTTLQNVLRGARAKGSYDKVFNSLCRLSVLIIDDFGLKPIQPPFDEDFHELVAERYERSPIILTSNLDFDEWAEVFSNRMLGAATLDRLQHHAYQLTLAGKSFRTPHGGVAKSSSEPKQANEMNEAEVGDIESPILDHDDISV